MISLIISLVILCVVAAVAVWLVKYLGMPDIAVKVIVVLAVLAALIMLTSLFTGWGWYDGRIYHSHDVGVIVH